MSYALVALGLAMVIVGWLCVMSGLPDTHLRGMPVLIGFGSLLAGAGMYVMLAA